MTPFEMAVIVLLLPGALFGALLMLLLLVSVVREMGGKDE